VEMNYTKLVASKLVVTLAHGHVLKEHEQPSVASKVAHEKTVSDEEKLFVRKHMENFVLSKLMNG
jgi:hypothetical protein